MGFVKLLGLCLSMFGGAYLCGEIPLRCPMNVDRMRHLTTIGVGLLVGVSCIVIIPEGVHTYYGTKQTNHAMPTHTEGYNHIRDPALTLNESLAQTAVISGVNLDNEHAAPSSHQHAHHANEDQHDHAHEDEADPAHSQPHSDSHSHSHSDSHSHRECVDLSRSSTAVGLALVLGFVLMLLVDRIGGSEGHGHAHGGVGDAQEFLTSTQHYQRVHCHEEEDVGHAHTHAAHDSNHEKSRDRCAFTQRSSSGPEVTRVYVRPSSASTTLKAASDSSIPQVHVQDSSLSRSPSHSQFHAHSIADHPRSQNEARGHEHAIDRHELQSEHEHEDLDSTSEVDEHKGLLAKAESTSPAVQQSPLAVRHDPTATFGILVHSAIDGLALGAISVSDNSRLEFVVFIAIILHKAPAAFGLTAFLMHQGREKNEVRRHLLYFALAAPVTSLLTFLTFYSAPMFGAPSPSLSASSPTGHSMLGLCLLLSAGTFLFTIAVHILPEIRQNTNNKQHMQHQHAANTKPDDADDSTHQHQHQHDHAHQPSPGGGSDWKMVACLITGILAPLAFSSHDHGH